MKYKKPSTSFLLLGGFNSCLLQDGSMIALDSYNCLMHIDQHTGEILRTMYDDYGGDRRYNSFYITDDEQVTELYDLETWELKGRDDVLNSFIKGPEGACSADGSSYDPDGFPGSISASMQHLFTCPGRRRYMWPPGADYTGMGFSGLMALGIFAWIFSGRMLRPIAESRRRQVPAHPARHRARRRGGVSSGDMTLPCTVYCLSIRTFLRNIPGGIP